MKTILKTSLPLAVSLAFIYGDIRKPNNPWWLGPETVISKERVEEKKPAISKKTVEEKQSTVGPRKEIASSPFVIVAESEDVPPSVAETSSPAKKGRLAKRWQLANASTKTSPNEINTPSATAVDCNSKTDCGVMPQEESTDCANEEASDCCNMETEEDSDCADEDAHDCCNMEKNTDSEEMYEAAEGMELGLVDADGENVNLLNGDGEELSLLSAGGDETHQASDHLMDEASDEEAIEEVNDEDAMDQASDHLRDEAEGKEVDLVTEDSVAIEKNSNAEPKKCFLSCFSLKNQDAHKLEPSSGGEGDAEKGTIFYVIHPPKNQKRRKKP